MTSDNKLFIFGQEVDNFNGIKKDYIFTIATAALQQVDRELQAEKIKTETLNIKVSSLESLTLQMQD